MEVPKIFIKDNKKYELIKQYPSFYLYEDIDTGIKECFSLYDLGLLQERMPKPRKINMMPIYL